VDVGVLGCRQYLDELRALFDEPLQPRQLDSLDHGNAR
jgi:hypothetical protein